MRGAGNCLLRFLHKFPHKTEPVFFGERSTKNSGTATLQNSIVSNSGSNCSGTITSGGYNLSSDGSCAFSNSGDRNNTSPVLGTLAYYGGPTPTIPLLTSSPAICKSRQETGSFHPAGTIGMPGYFGNVRLSPDGHRVAADQTDPDGRRIDIWVHELARGVMTRLTFDPSLHQTPIWSPDGKQILFTTNHKLSFPLYLKNADGSGPEVEVADPSAGLQVNPWDWSRDAKYILFKKANELWYVSWPERLVKPLLQAKWTVRNAQFSPDGRWMAYASNETGKMEIYVSPFLSGIGKWQASTAGGREPRWRHDGKELFYLSADGKMMAVSVKTGASFEAGSPVALFQTHARQPVSSQDQSSYDVSGDGQRFLIITKTDEANAAPLSILLNWASELAK